MSHDRKKTDKLLKAGIAILALLIPALLVSLGIRLAGASGYETIPEPSFRPDVPADAVWDGRTGMYVRNETEGAADVPSSGSRVPDPDLDPADPVHKAILYVLEHEEETQPFLSSVQPGDSRAVKDALSLLSASDLPDLFREACTEPAYRALKLCWLEMILQTDLGYGLYDAAAQESWYSSFMALKSSLPPAEITESDYAGYGALLLPCLVSKLKEERLSENECAVLFRLQNDLSGLQIQGIVPVRVEDTEGALRWITENASVIEAVRAVAAAAPEWM